MKKVLDIKIAIFISLIIIFFSLFASSVYAVFNPLYDFDLDGDIDFGGIVTIKWQCQCEPQNQVVYIWDYLGGIPKLRSLLETPIVYNKGQGLIMPNDWILGSYIPVIDSCSVLVVTPVGATCVPITPLLDGQFQFPIIEPGLGTSEGGGII